MESQIQDLHKQAFPDLYQEVSITVVADQLGGGADLVRAILIDTPMKVLFDQWCTDHSAARESVVFLDPDGRALDEQKTPRTLGWHGAVSIRAVPYSAYTSVVDACHPAGGRKI